MPQELSGYKDSDPLLSELIWSQWMEALKVGDQESELKSEAISINQSQFFI